MNQVATNAFVAGKLSFDGTDKIHYLDITGVIKKHPSENYIFILVRETHHAGDEEDKDITINMLSKEGNNGAQLIYWIKK
ncbi:hypothetical protein I5M32_08020 [Pedobacter sp. SD-b]|uniref:Uncharacterized protein n=1 Tax=Pedobacter segetis TaxID=2793069 RepID=A0ABS1BJ57_9SPHI|nr:hypothetical protein [Pedobacter segetis]MBK0382904.1 hypothetical protein [Pedobacter segetis]